MTSATVTMRTDRRGDLVVELTGRNAATLARFPNAERESAVEFARQSAKLLDARLVVESNGGAA